MSNEELKALADAAVSSLDAAPSQSSFTLNVEDLSAEEVKAFATRVIDASKTSRAQAKGIRAGGIAIAKLGINPMVGFGRWNDVPVVPHAEFDTVEFVFAPRIKKAAGVSKV